MNDTTPTAVDEARAILRANGIRLTRLSNGRWQTTTLDSSRRMQTDNFQSWMGACDRWARFCQSERLYQICAGTPSILAERTPLAERAVKSDLSMVPYGSPAKRARKA